MDYRALLGGALLLGGLAAGCGRPVEPDAPTVGRVAAETPEAYSTLYEAAADTLRRKYFRLDRQDRLEGILTTHPETSASWFELWRPQPEPVYHWLEANLSTIQRRAQVRFVPSAAEPGSYEVDVEVQRLRYNLMERQIDNSAAAMRLYSGAAPTQEGRVGTAAETSYWIPLGRDPFAEQRLLTAIVKRYTSRPAATQPAAAQ